MSNVLGIYSHGPNPSACLVKDGKIVAIAEEERFLRRKEIEIEMPIKAIEYCLEEAQLSFWDVDVVAYAWDAHLYWGPILAQKFKSWLPYALQSKIFSVGFDEFIKRAFYLAFELGFRNPSVIKRRLCEPWSSVSGGHVPIFRFVKHHLAHAASVFYTSGMEKAAILTVDRNGEDKSTVFWVGEKLEIRPTEEVKLPNSLGWYYSGFTDFLGFAPEYQEGKLMGLSSYGRPDKLISEKISKVLSVHSDGTYKLDPSYFYYGRGTGHYTSKLVDLFGDAYRGDRNNIPQEYADLAFAVQSKLEEALCGLVKRLIKETKVKDVCLAGGVALNCVANGKISNLKEINKLYVSPVSNDVGSALGAALIATRDLGVDPRIALDHAYWGPGENDEEVLQKLTAMGIAYMQPISIGKAVAEELDRGKVVGWYQGRMEAGPRALGGRSILGDPRNLAVRDRINRIKGREPWRPLAPAILEERLNDFFLSAHASPFMTQAYEVLPSKRKQIEGVVHVDGTTRPQTVNQRAVNRRFLEVINHFDELTGIPMIVNTSFNVGGEPIVCKVEDAIRTFFGSGLDLLAIGPAIVKKSFSYP